MIVIAFRQGISSQVLQAPVVQQEETTGLSPEKCGFPVCLTAKQTGRESHLEHKIKSIKNSGVA